MLHKDTIHWLQIVTALPPRISEILIQLHTIATSAVRRFTLSAERLEVCLIMT